jgi:hypothetical protein
MNYVMMNKDRTRVRVESEYHRCLLSGELSYLYAIPDYLVFKGSILDKLWAWNYDMVLVKETDFLNLAIGLANNP